ncbi:hypothetical protein QMK34_26170, partial [Amycolatopsis sp. H20-H5]|nr:hypothetical protein [Amycolatopsis sp. H20-H5]
MKRSFWRRRGRQATGDPSVPPPAGDPVPPPLRRDWSRLPVLSTTGQRRPPTLAPILRPPDVAGTRALLKPLPPLRHPPITGQVTGLARIARASGAERVGGRHVPLAPSPPVSRSDPGAAPPAGIITEAAEIPAPVRAVRALPAVERPRHPVPELTQAIDEYLGEPRVSDFPHRSTARYDRLVDSWRVQAKSGAAALDLGMLDGFIQADGGLASTASAPMGEPGPAPAQSADRTVLRHTLAQSRKLGLRAQRGEGGEGGADEAEAAEPEPEADPAEAVVPVVATETKRTEPQSAPPFPVPGPVRPPCPAENPPPAPRLGLGEPLTHPPRPRRAAEPGPSPGPRAAEPPRASGSTPSLPSAPLPPPSGVRTHLPPNVPAAPR